MKTVSVFVLLCLYVNATGQRIDSLREKLTQFPKHDTTHVNILNKLSWFLSFEKFDSAMLIGRQSFKIADSLKYYYGGANASYSIGTALFRNGDLEKANEEFLKTVDYCIRHDQKQTLSHALNGIAGIHENQGNYVQALDNYLQSLRIFEQLHNSRGVQGVYHNLGLLYMKLGDSDEALKYFRKSLALVASINYNAQEKASIVNNIATAFMLKKDYPNALSYYKTAYGTISKKPEMLPKARYLCNMGLCYARMDSLMESEKSLQEASRLTEEGHLADLKYFIMNNLCELRLKQNRPAEAVVYGEKAMQFFKNSSMSHHLVNCLLLLTKGDSLLHDYKKALAYSTLAYHLNDSLKSSNLIINLADQKKGYEMAKKQSQIELLSQQAKTKELQLEREQMIRYALIVGVGLLLVFFVLAKMALRTMAKLNKRLEENYAEVQGQKETIEGINYDLRSQALCAQMNPHFIFNCMTAVDSFILKNERQRSSDLLTSFAKLTRLVLENSERKTISLEQELESLELYLKIEKIRFGDSFQYSIHCNPQLDFDLPPLLLQPYVENAIIHGISHETIANKKIEIVVTCEDDDTLVITITDNGIGRKSASDARQAVQTRRSLGMKITSERLSLLRLSNKIRASMEVIDLEDNAGNTQGTQVKVSLKKEDVLTRQFSKL